MRRRLENTEEKTIIITGTKNLLEPWKLTSLRHAIAAKTTDEALLQEQDGREEEDDGGLQLVSICAEEKQSQRDRRERERETWKLLQLQLSPLVVARRRVNELWVGGIRVL